ncbi:MAG: PKD-like domain-containing protein, partial [bacterium]
GVTTPVVWTSPTPGATFSWKLISVGASVTGQSGDNAGTTLQSMQLFNPSVQQQTVIYEVSSTADKCSAPASVYTIYVNPDAKATFTYDKDFECWPFDLKTTGNIQNTSPLTASDRYEWFANGQLIGTTRDFPGYTIPNPNEQVEIKLVA